MITKSQTEMQDVKFKVVDTVSKIASLKIWKAKTSKHKKKRKIVD